MLPSPDLPVRVIASAGSPMASVSLMDYNLKVLAQGIGSLEMPLAKGIYKARYDNGGTPIEEFFEVTGEEDPLTLKAPRLPGPIGPAPLRSSASSEADVEDLAHALSKETPIVKGMGCLLFVCVRAVHLSQNAPLPVNPAKGLVLCDFHGTRLVELGNMAPRLGCVGCNISLDAGSYVLRVERAGKESLEQTIVTCHGWQTQVFLPLEFLGSDETEPQPNLTNAAIFMAREGSGFKPDDERASWVETARQKLAFRAPSIHSTSEGTSTDGKLLEYLLGDLPWDPMLGIYGAHLMMTYRSEETDAIRKVANRLVNLVGEHPDVQSIYYWLDSAAAVASFERPPMLCTSWNVLVNRSRVNENVIPPRSYSLRIANRLWGAGNCWLVWSQPGPEDERAVAPSPTDVAQAWERLGMFIGNRLATQPPAEFVREKEAAVHFTTTESAVLQYAVGIAYQQILGRTLITKLDHSEWAVPSELQNQIEKASMEYLSKSGMVQKLGLPMAALNEALPGLVNKLNS
jgi:hypothetical protein